MFPFNSFGVSDTQLEFVGVVAAPLMTIVTAMFQLCSQCIVFCMFSKCIVSMYVL